MLVSLYPLVLFLTSIYLKASVHSADATNLTCNPPCATNCQTCVNNSVCQTWSNSCYIGQQCYSSVDSFTWPYRCLKCSPTDDQFQWTFNPACSADDLCHDPTFLHEHTCEPSLIFDFYRNPQNATTTHYNFANCSADMYEKLGYACQSGFFFRTINATMMPYACCPGYFCPTGQICMIPCRSSGYCPSPLKPKNHFCTTPAQCPSKPPNQFETIGCGGSSVEGFCPQQYYCPNASQRIPCHSSHDYCPPGMIKPLKCPFLFKCQEGQVIVSITRRFTFGIVVIIIVLFCLGLRICDYCKRSHPHRGKSRSVRLSKYFLVHCQPQTNTDTEGPLASSFHICLRNACLKNIKEWPSNNCGYDIVFQPGEITGIMGQSGCGKTSLLYALQGRSSLKSGIITIGGYKPLKSHLSNVIAYVPQEDVMHSNLTVEETVFHSARARRLSADNETIRIDVKHVLEKLRMTGEKLNELTKTLSGGEKKRVNIAMEIAACPRILLLDEPTSGLDSTLSKILFDFLSEIKSSDAGLVTIVMIIHQPSSELFKQLDNVVFITPNHWLAYQGRPQEAKPTILQRVLEEKRLNASRENESDTCIALLPSIERYANQPAIDVNTNETSNIVPYGIRALYYPIGLLMWRTSIQIFLRENIVEGAYCLGYFFLGVIVGFVHDYQHQTCNVQSIPSLYFMITLSFGLTTCVSSQRLFGVEMVDNTFVRETRTHYHPFQYWLAKSIIECIRLFVYPLLYLALLYIQIVPRAGFSDYYRVVLLISVTCSGIGQLTSVMFLRTEHAYLAAVLFGLFSCMVSGFNPRKDRLGDIVYLSFSRHAQRLLFKYDSNAYLTQDNDNLWSTQIEQVRAYYSFGDNENSILWLLGMGVICRLITLFLLYVRSEYRSQWRHLSSKPISYFYKTR